jgi:hypothetical protein
VTKKEPQDFVEKNLRKNSNPMIDIATGLDALGKVASVAEDNGVAYALVGGIAMHLYGSPRLTREVDVIATARLPLTPEKRLGFGGERYNVKLGKRVVPVDCPRRYGSKIL